MGMSTLLDSVCSTTRGLLLPLHVRSSNSAGYLSILRVLLPTTIKCTKSDIDTIKYPEVYNAVDVCKFSD